MEENELSNGNDVSGVLGVVEGNLNKIDLQMDDEIDLEGFTYRKDFATASQEGIEALALYHGHAGTPTLLQDGEGYKIQMERY
ncbi:MAG: hypothetical protein LUQ65_09530 [Candidatus Helarchaeota archaeon]|nr:hypothetical protein [Candidatus Helarchaeota archaeon]